MKEGECDYIAPFESHDHAIPPREFPDVTSSVFLNNYPTSPCDKFVVALDVPVSTLPHPSRLGLRLLPDCLDRFRTTGHRMLSDLRRGRSSCNKC